MLLELSSSPTVTGERRKVVPSRLRLAEAKYPIIEKECLAVVCSIRCFKIYLASKRFTLQTDHKPQKYLKDAAYQNDRVFCWAMAVQEYFFRVEDIPGKENIGQISGYSS